MDPNDLLGWHGEFAPLFFYTCPVLFDAVKKDTTLKHFTEAGYNLGPYLGYCIEAPVHRPCGNSGEDEPIIVRNVWEQFSLLMWAAAFGQPDAVKTLLHLGELGPILSCRLLKSLYGYFNLSVALMEQPIVRDGDTVFML